MHASEKLLWITNHPGGHRGMWPRRLGVVYLDGPPKATEVYSEVDLRGRNILGVYVEVSRDTYDRLPKITRPGRDNRI